MLLTLALHGLLAALAPVLAGRVGRRVFAICALAPAATLAWAAAHGPALVAGGSVVERVTWAAALGIEVTLRVDALSLLMLWIVSGVGVLVLVYAVSYFHREPGLGRAAGALTAFAGAMAGLVVADNLFALYVFWELTSIASYVLIGFDDRDRQAREAAQHALLMTAGGGMAMLAGFVVLGQAAGSYSLSGILAAPPGGVGVGVGLGLVLVGAFTKSAQVPFHGWLPAAMAAPTPVSAYLHAASMVKAGVYLVARLAPAFAPAYPFWRPLVVVVGLATLVHGAVLALRQHDLKLLLAYGTVSQLGLMVALVGAGDPKLTAAGLAILLAHALYKAVLFLVVGIVEHEAGSRDIRVLEGAARAMPVTLALAAVSAASMMGIPPLFGYVAKEAALDNLVTLAGDAAAVAVLAAVVAGAALTVAYGARFLAGGFGDWWRSAEQQPKRPHGEVGPVLLAPAAVLAVLTVALGAAPALATAVLEPAAAVLDPAAAGTKLKLWHGVTPALGLSLLSLLLGAALFASRQAVGRLQTRAQRLPDAHEVFSSTVAAVVRLSARVTAVVQNGSLPVYLGVILLTAVVAPGLGLVRVATPRV
ncbi:MAG: NADH ubiquinone oxidoreductase subunit NDUFA12, partial [Actinomycetota bacterium]|nr:NADH ubiquinone oxidoreductase subunit NDUFA12 [Actinomycetota bacterium]